MFITQKNAEGGVIMKTITPVLKSISSPDVFELDKFSPESGSEFLLLLEAVFGPSGGESGEVFSFEVCSPEWIKRQSSKGIFAARHLIIVDKFNFADVKSFIQKLASSCVGENWNEAALKLSRHGQWEFEDYKP